MWPGFIWNVLENWRLHLDDSGACLLDVAGVHLERSRKWRLHLDESGGSLLDVAGVHLERSRSKNQNVFSPPNPE